MFDQKETLESVFTVFSGEILKKSFNAGDFK